MDDRGTILGKGKGFYIRPRIQIGSGAHPVSYPVGTGALSPGEHRPGHEADQSPPPSTEIKKEWSYTSTTPYVFMAWCLAITRDNFTFTIVYFTTLSAAHTVYS
jgi:hypothetical protein